MKKIVILFLMGAGAAVFTSAQFLAAGWDFSQYPVANASTFDGRTFVGSSGCELFRLCARKRSRPGCRPCRNTLL